MFDTLLRIHHVALFCSGVNKLSACTKTSMELRTETQAADACEGNILTLRERVCVCMR